MPPPEEGRTPWREMGQGSEEGMHKCQKCGQTFNTQQELDTHMEEQHGGETPEMGDALGE